MDYDTNINKYWEALESQFSGTSVTSIKSGPTLTPTIAMKEGGRTSKPLTKAERDKLINDILKDQ